jgi:hypothetical protein
LAPDLAEDLHPNFLIETVSKQQYVNLGALFGKQYRGLELILDSVRVLFLKKNNRRTRTTKTNMSTYQVQSMGDGRAGFGAIEIRSDSVKDRAGLED